MAKVLEILRTELAPPILVRGLRVVRNWIQRENSDRAPPGVRAADWYNQAYEQTASYHQHYTESHYYFVWAVIADRMVRSGVKKVIDLGCGPGQFALLLHDKKVGDYYGLDFSSKSIEMAKQGCPFFEFAVVDLSKTDILQTATYDCIVSLEFLEHVEFDLELIGRIRPGTKFFGTVPNFPYISHVRHFVDATEVHSRYGRLFNNFTVDTFLGDADGKTYFLMEGIKS